MAYVYRHIREDLNVPFYVGYGKDNKGAYTRANTKHGRSKYWKNIVSKTNYKVDIVYDNIDCLNELKQKEIEFIALYGRRNLGLGTLVNLTDGGDGGKGVKQTVQHIEKKYTFPKGHKPWNTGITYKISTVARKKSKAEKDKMAEASIYKISISQYENEIFIKTYPSITEASKQTGISMTCLRNNIKGVTKTAGGYVFKKEKNSVKEHPQIKTTKTEEYKLQRRFSKLNVPIDQYTLGGVFIKSFMSINECCREMGFVTNSVLRDTIKGKYKYCGNHTYTLKGEKPKYIFPKIIQTTLEGVELDNFYQIKEASKKTGVNGSYISANLSGKRNTASGYIFKYEMGLQ